MWLSITASFPLGTYQGRTVTEQSEAVPSLARLHAALLAAASAAPFAVPSAWGTRATDEDLRAIEWLETHPADAVELPLIRRPDLKPVAYREKGYRNGKNWNGSTKLAEPATRAHAYSGPLRWYWDLGEEGDGSLVETLDRLAAEVPFLGEASSPVRLDVETEREPGGDALRRSKALRPLRLSGGLSVSAPLAGRARKLIVLHADQYTKPPSAAADKLKDGEGEVKDPYLHDLLTTVGYLPAKRDVATPWTTGHLLDIEVFGSPQTLWAPTAQWHVGWAVAVHRALVKIMSPDVPPLVSGRYAEGTRPPANRLAVHVLMPHLPLADHGFGGSAKILIALPAGVSPEDQAAVSRAVRKLRAIRRARDAEGLTVADVHTDIDLVNFWRPLDDNFERWWMPTPLAIADTRPPVAAARDGRRWGAAEALRLALAFVRRDKFSSRETGDRRFVDLARQVEEEGIEVAAARRVTPERIERYVHKTHAETPITALSGLLNLALLGNERAFLAIGQSRHLGGGMLAPVDFPLGALTSEGVPL